MPFQAKGGDCLLMQPRISIASRAGPAFAI
jgi:hypothetical protein